MLSLACLRPSAGGSGVTSILAPSRLLSAHSHTPWYPDEGQCKGPIEEATDWGGTDRCVTG